MIGIGKREVGLLQSSSCLNQPRKRSIFDYPKRSFQRTQTYWRRICRFQRHLCRFIRAIAHLWTFSLRIDRWTALTLKMKDFKNVQISQSNHGKICDRAVSFKLWNRIWKNAMRNCWGKTPIRSFVSQIWSHSLWVPLIPLCKWTNNSQIV